MKLRFVLGMLMLLSYIALCTGCGGGSSSPATSSQAGSIQFNINWPSDTRVIPRAARSLVITVTAGQQILATRIIPRPPAGVNTSSERFDSLSPGVITVTVTAFPNTDGTGVAQAIGTSTVVIIPGVLTQANIDPTSTVDHLELTPANPTTIPGGTVALSVSPKNAQNALVLVSPQSLTWSSSQPTAATVDTNGVITGVQLGSTTVRVIDTESGQTTTAAVNVVAPLVVSPNSATVSIGDSVQFTATVTGLSGNGVTWSVVEQGGGVISATGLYTAPDVAGTYHVRATATANPTISVTATVTVQSGDGTIRIH